MPNTSFTRMIHRFTDGCIWPQKPNTDHQTEAEAESVGVHSDALTPSLARMILREMQSSCAAGHFYCIHGIVRPHQAIHFLLFCVRVQSSCVYRCQYTLCASLFRGILFFKSNQLILFHIVSKIDGSTIGIDCALCALVLRPFLQHHALSVELNAVQRWVSIMKCSSIFSAVVFNRLLCVVCMCGWRGLSFSTTQHHIASHSWHPNNTKTHCCDVTSRCVLYRLRGAATTTEKNEELLINNK